MWCVEKLLVQWYLCAAPSETKHGTGTKVNDKRKNNEKQKTKEMTKIITTSTHYHHMQVGMEAMTFHVAENNAVTFSSSENTQMTS